MAVEMGRNPGALIRVYARRRGAMGEDLVSVLEAAYRVDADERAWLEGVLVAARQRFNHPWGALAFTYDISKSALVQTSVGVGPNHAALSAANDLMTRGAPDEVRRGLIYGTTFGAASGNFGGELPAPLSKHLAEAGLAGFEPLGLVTPNPTGRGVCVTSAVPVGTKIRQADRAAWTRIAVHLSAAFRLRERKTGPEAILSPTGKVEHAEENAKSKDARDALRTMARAIERARGKLRRNDPHEAVELWRALAAGRWSLLDHFDHDGRRYLIARRNEPETRPWHKLTERERAVVAFAAMGHANKLIGYELGMGTSAVSAALTSASRKVGASSRMALITAYRQDDGS